MKSAEMVDFNSYCETSPHHELDQKHSMDVNCLKLKSTTTLGSDKVCAEYNKILKHTDKMLKLTNSRECKVIKAVNKQLIAQSSRS